MHGYAGGLEVEKQYPIEGEYQIQCENGESFSFSEKAVNLLLKILDNMTDWATGGYATLGHIVEKLKRQKENGKVLGLTKIEAELLQPLIQEQLEKIENVASVMPDNLLLSGDQDILSGFQRICQQETKMDEGLKKVEAPLSEKIRIKETGLKYQIRVSFLEAISVHSMMKDLMETEGSRGKISQKIKAKMELAMDTLKEESVLDGVETPVLMTEKEIAVTCSMLLQIIPLYAEKEDPDFWNHVLPALIACDRFRRKCEKERKSQVPPILWKLPDQEPFTLTLPQMEDLLSICYLLEPEQPDEALVALRQKLSEQLNRIRSGNNIICIFTEEETVLLKNVKDRYRKIYSKIIKRGFPEYPEDIWICCL